MRVTNQSKPSYFKIGFIITLMRSKIDKLGMVNGKIATVACTFTVMLSNLNLFKEKK